MAHQDLTGNRITAGLRPLGLDQLDICYLITGSHPMPIHDSYSLLTLEGHLIHASITHGLTALRTADINKKGIFYSAFFLTSIGLERLMKVILVVDHMARHALDMPSNKVLRKHGHDLIALFEYLKSLPDPAPNPLSRLSHSGLPYKILSFLSDFAETTRYYNLDSLVSAVLSGDPLSEWNRILGLILAQDVRSREKQKAKAGAMIVAEASCITFVIQKGLDGAPLTLHDLAMLQQTHDLASPHAVFHVLELVQPLKEQLDDAVERASQTARSLGITNCPVPHMVEFLDFFSYDKNLILKKRRWP